MDFAQAVKKSLLYLPQTGFERQRIVGTRLQGRCGGFDPAAVMDKATLKTPPIPKGIPHVWVNGVHTIFNGTHTGALSGHII